MVVNMFENHGPEHWGIWQSTSGTARAEEPLGKAREAGLPGLTSGTAPEGRLGTDNSR